jgi:drug/metabolite transporter (DMT)-like permease
MKTRSLYLVGIALGFLSAVGSAAIAIVLADKTQVPTNWVLLIQSAVALFVSCALLAAGNVLSARHDQEMHAPIRLRTCRYGTHVLRAAAGLAIYGFYYKSLKSAPTVDCSLLLNTAPLFVPLICKASGDRVPLRVWVGIMTGFVGIAVVLMPSASFKALEPGHLLALIAGICFAFSTVLVRDLNRTEHVNTTVLYYNLHSFLCLLAVTAFTNEPISRTEIAFCLAVGVVFCIKQYAITLAIKLTSPSTAAILNFSTIPLLALYGVFVEAKSSTFTTMIGIGLVAFGSVSVLLKKHNPVR